MNQPSETWGLRCPDGREAQLLSVQVHGEILGLMLRLTVRQVWRNASGAPMATRLHFPLGWNQALLGLELQRPSGTQTLDKVWRESRQGCSATPGVLATGEQVTLQWRIGQLLDLQGSSLRLQLPAGLIPRAARPAQISMEVHEPVAQGTVSCTSHDMQRVRHANGVRLSLHAPAGLDRDLVFTVHGLRDSSFPLASPDPVVPDACTVLVSSSVRLQDAAPAPLRMKLLVDSSGAMPSERLGSIRTALDRLLAQLLAQDQLSYSHFAERTVHALPRLQVCTEAYQRRVRALARQTDSETGQADPLAALLATLAIPDEDEQAVTAADILLITASPLWAIDAALPALRAAGHRLHVMVVGEDGAGLWQELAEASGGSFELLAPGQHSLQPLTRLIARMRQLQPVQACLAIGGADVLGHTASLRHMADGDTLHLWAQTRLDSQAQDLTGRPNVVAGLAWHDSGAQAPAVQHRPPSEALWDPSGDLTRLCAARQLQQDSPTRQLLRIGQYGLIVPDTSRLAASTVQGQSPGAATSSPVASASASPPEQPSRVPAAVHTLRSPAPRHTDLAGWLGAPLAPGNPLAALLECFDGQASQYAQFRAALSSTLQRAPTRLLDGLVLQLARQAGNPGRVWAMVLHWLHAEHEFTLHAPALRLLDQELADIPVTVRRDTVAALAHAALPAAGRRAA